MTPHVSRETAQRLETFLALFEDWADRINLVAPSTRADVRTRHVADSLSLLAHAPDARHWADLGTGGGFPGLVLAIALSDRAGAHVDLVESDRRKAAFLATAAQACAPAARVHARRIEVAVPALPRPQVVTARALAPLDRLLDLAGPWLAGGTLGLFPKGESYAQEIAAARARHDFDLRVHPAATGPGAVLEITRLAPATAPRPFADSSVAAQSGTQTQTRPATVRRVAAARP